MKRLASFCVLILVLLMTQGMGVPWAAASPAKDGDFGVWNAYEIEKKLNDQWKIKAVEEVRFREHNGLYYAETRVGVDYKPSKYLAMGAEYQEIVSSQWKKKQNMWYWESVPRIYLTPQFKFKGFLLEDRNMLEFKVKQDTHFSVRYRNLVTLTAPWKWTRFQCQPFTANEIFVQSGKNGLVEDRLYGGVKVHWWGPFYGSIYYLRDATKNSIGKWKALNTLGTSLKLSF